MELSRRIGRDDLLFVTLDTLRYDVATTLAEQGRTPNLVRALPGGVWQRRHTPGSFTYAAHHAFFAGFLPTPAEPTGDESCSTGQERVRHERLFAARFAGSETTGERTWVFDAPDLVTALADAGYHTVCIGGVGFFNLASPLGRVLPGLFTESHWEPEFGVTRPACLEAQLDRIEAVVAAVPPEQALFVFLNVSALHQPNRHYLPGATHDTVESHASALEYVDQHMGRLFSLLTARGRDCATIVCSDHGTAYGEGGRVGHRFANEVVWTVPYAEFVLRPGQWGECR